MKMGPAQPHTFEKAHDPTLAVCTMGDAEIAERFTDDLTCRHTRIQ